MGNRVNSIQKGNRNEREFSKILSSILNVPLQRTPLYLRKLEIYFGDMIPTLESGIDPKTFPYLIQVRARREAFNKKGFFTPVIKRWFFDVVRQTLDIQRKLKQDFRKNPILAIKGVGRFRGKWLVIIEDTPPQMKKYEFLETMGKNKINVIPYEMVIDNKDIPDDLRPILEIKRVKVNDVNHQD